MSKEVQLLSQIPPQAESSPAPARQALTDETKIRELAEQFFTDDAPGNFDYLGFARALLALDDGKRVPDELREIGHLIATQDNRITDQPMFIVQQKLDVITEVDYEDYYEWRETESGEYSAATPQQHKCLDALYQAAHETPGWKRFSMATRWEFVTACFTEQGCKDYLKANGHNLKETRIYADGSYRNREYQTVRNWLLSLAAPSTEAKQGGGKTE